MIVDPSTFSVQGNFTQTSTGTLGTAIAGPSNYDQFLITGLATLDGTLDLTFVPGYTPALGDSFDLFKYGAETGEFATVDVTGLASGYSVMLDYGANGLTATIGVSTVPEPPSLVPAGTAALAVALVMIRRRRR